MREKLQSLFILLALFLANRKNGRFLLVKKWQVDFSCSRSLRQYRNYKFHVSVRLLTIKISQWAREDIAVIGKYLLTYLNCLIAVVWVRWKPIINNPTEGSIVVEAYKVISYFVINCVESHFIGLSTLTRK